MTAQARWHVAIIYRSTNGPIAVEHTFEELSDLHDFVEAGPDWNTIASIVVTLARTTTPGLTLEQARAR